MRFQFPELVIKNLEAHAAAGYRRFFFVDNVFNLPPDYAEAVCEAIAGARLDIAWQAIVYPRHLSPGLVEKMARAGCTHVSLGFESGSKQILSRVNGLKKEISSLKKKMDELQTRKTELEKQVIKYESNKNRRS